MSDGKKILILALAMAAAIAVAVAAIFMIGAEFQSRAEYNKVFFAEAIPEIKFDEEAMLEEAKRDEEIRKRDAMAELDIVIEKKAKLENKPELDEPAIVVDGEVITKKVIERMKISIEYRNKYLISDEQDMLKSELAKAVRNIITRKEVERKTKMPTREEVEERLQMLREATWEFDDEYQEKYLASQGLTEEECWQEIEKESIYVKREEKWIEEITSANELEIKQEALRRNISEYECGISWYMPRYVDKLVGRVKIEILDPEVKALFGVEE